MSAYVPIVHYKYNDLCKREQQISQIRNSLVSVIHTRKVYHIQSLDFIFHVVNKWNSSAISFSSPRENLHSKNKATDIILAYTIANYTKVVFCEKYSQINVGSML